MLKKILGYLLIILAGSALGFSAVYLLYEKTKEKKLGGKLIRVNYRFSKDFED
ncbi:MAG: stress-responsive transcriptional regulator PspC [Eubacteriaceae bacterium]|nr:stress-responsive transcriptional regulator PspC [Eubacteriaceae bacterium]MBR0383548.1 stress-responsive transcriptional regulator PspC [Eubacteriaceae bacterium]